MSNIENTVCDMMILCDDMQNLSDSDLETIMMLSLPIEKIKAEQRKRRVAAEAQAVREKNEAKQKIGITINNMMQQVREIPEYGELCMMVGLIPYCEKRNKKSDVIRLSVKIEDTLEKYGINDPRVVAHLVRVGSST